MIIGYARVSKREQNLESQLDALHKAGCDRIYSDKISSRKAERPQLKAVLALLQEGDTLVIWRLSRVGRSLRELIDIVGSLQERKIEFRSLTENIDTTTSGGRFFFHIFGAVAEYDRDIISENTHLGLEAARERGRVGGRSRAMNDDQVRIAHALAAQNIPREQIGQLFKVSRATLYRYLSAPLAALLLTDGSLFECAMSVF